MIDQRESKVYAGDFLESPEFSESRQRKTSLGTVSGVRLHIAVST